MSVVNRFKLTLKMSTKNTESSPNRKILKTTALDNFTETVDKHPSPPNAAQSDF